MENHRLLPLFIRDQLFKILSSKQYLSILFIISFIGIGLAFKHLSFDDCQINSNKPAVVGTPVTFSITCPAGEETSLIAWDFGDGTGLGPYTNQTTTTHTYRSTGTFTVFARKQGEDFPLQSFQTIVEPITTPGPTHSSTIVHDTSSAIVWSVNPDNNSVTGIHSNTLDKIFETTVGVHPRTVAVENNGNGWVTNEDDATISVVNKTGTLLKNISLPYASRPYGICFDPQGANAFVTLSGTGKLMRINPATAQVTGEVSIGSFPRGIAISSDGKRVLITRFISPVNRGEITEVNAQTMTVTRIIPLAFDNTPDFEDKGRGVPNYISSITISPNGKVAWVPSKKDNVARGKYRDGLALTFESTVRTIASKINLVNNTEDLSSRIDINDADMANAVEFSPYGNIAFIALQGTNKIQVRDVASNAFILNINQTGLAPQGMAFNKDGSKLFVQNFMSRTVRVYNTEGLILGSNTEPTVLKTINTVTTELLSAQVLKGKQIFYNAEDTRMTFAGYISCASCHLDGGSDQRVWDFTDRGEGLRKTITLNGRSGTQLGNVHWTGNFDEIHDFENDIRNSFGGTGFMTDADFNATKDPLGTKKAGRSVDLDALAAYVTSLTKVHPSPYKNPNGTFTAEALSGKTVFDQAGCGSCHSGSNFTDRKTNTLHDVGTIQASSGKRLNQTLTGFATPTLKGIWETAPYLHDGSAATLRDVLITKNTSGKHGNTASLSSTQINQLIAYLNQIDDVSSCTSQTITFTDVPDKNSTDAAFTLSASATSALPVSYRVLSGPATISGNTVTLTGVAGTVVLAANQSGNATYCPAAQVTQSIQVTSPSAGIALGTYKLINKSSNKALDNNGSLSNGSLIMHRTDNASSNRNQQWQISPIGNGYYKLVNKTSGKALDNSGSTTANTQIIQWTDNAASNHNQQWSISRLANGAYKLLSRKSNMALDNANGSTAEGNLMVQWPDAAASNANQQWEVVPVTESLFPSGIYKVTAKHSGKSIDIAGLSTGNNAAVNQWDYNGGENQKMKIEHTGNGYFTITPLHSGKPLQLPTGSLADDANIFQGPYTNTDYQKWIIRNVGSGYYELIAKHSGKAMAVRAASTTNGASIVQLGTGGTANQQWALQDLSLLRVGASETESAVAVQLYPNPAKEKVYVAFSNDSKEKVAIRVVNLQGVEVYKNETSSSELLIQTASLKPGIYTISIHGNSINVSKKLVLFE
jgi:DNA-binding beta-propeller fold protein YncE/cytochrome c551/c552